MNYLFKNLIIIFTLSPCFFWSQPTVQINDSDWIVNSSNGACDCSNDFNNGSFLNFFDSGGSTGSYNSNETEVITLCPDGSGSKMVVAFGINAGYT